MNDGAQCLTDRGACIAGKPRSNVDRVPSVGERLLAMNDDVVFLTDRGAWFAGKSDAAQPLQRIKHNSVGVSLLAMASGQATHVSLTHRIAGKRAPTD